MLADVSMRRVGRTPALAVFLVLTMACATKTRTAKDATTAQAARTRGRSAA